MVWEVSFAEMTCKLSPKGCQGWEEEYFRQMDSRWKVLSGGREWRLPWHFQGTGDKLKCDPR